MKKMRVLALCLTLTALLAACGDRGSGFSPAENAVTANPEETIDLRARDYELPPATPAPDGPTASYDTGDSSGGRTLTLDTLNPALERVAAGTVDEVADAVAENALQDGRSTTIADETSEGDAAEATGGDLNVVTDPAARPADAVVDPTTGGEVELEDTVEETDGETAAVQEDASADAVVTDAAATDVIATEQAEDETLAEQVDEAEEAVAAEAASEPTTDTTQEVNVETEAAEAEAEEDGAETGGVTEAATPAGLAQTASFDWEQLGETTYANCVACHQQNGQGIPGAFPPLAGHITELYNVEGGRKYIVNVVLYGLQGEIEVLGQPYNGLMAAWTQLSNEEIAATLNHELTSWGNDALLTDFSPILPEEVQVERATKLTSAQVLELRPELP